MQFKLFILMMRKRLVPKSLNGLPKVIKDTDSNIHKHRQVKGKETISRPEGYIFIKQFLQIARRIRRFLISRLPDSILPSCQNGKQFKPQHLVVRVPLGWEGQPMSQISNHGGFWKQPGRVRPERREGGSESWSLLKTLHKRQRVLLHQFWPLLTSWPCYLRSA